MDRKKEATKGFRTSGTIFLVIGIPFLVYVFYVGTDNPILVTIGLFFTFIGLALMFGANSLTNFFVEVGETKKKMDEMKVNEFSSSETKTLEKELQNLTEMKEKGIIDDEEYKKLRKKVISK